MIVFYALGGGFGHITRAVSVIRSLGLLDKVILIVSGSNDSDLPKLSSQFIYKKILDKNITPLDLSNFLVTQIEFYNPTYIFIDAFPAGILGELSGIIWPSHTQVIHCARLLKWDKYISSVTGEMPHYDSILLMERLYQEHFDFLKLNCTNLIKFELNCSDNIQDNGNSISKLPVWIVLHSGPESELLDLIYIAQEMALIEKINVQIVLISPRCPKMIPEGIIHYNVYPATIFFEIAERIFTACGFNVVNELIRYRHKHVYIPMSRGLDDQFYRAKLLRSGLYDSK